MTDPHRVELTTTGQVAGAAVVAARGPVTPAAVVPLRNGLVKRLADGVPVLLDVSGLRLDWAPAPEVFVTAVTAAGGWPLARLVLFGADPHTAERLSACGVPESVPLARTLDEAVALVDVRPALLFRRIDLPPEPLSVRRALAMLRDTHRGWDVPERDDLAAVVSALTTNAVEHARTDFRLRLVLDRAGFRVSVRDHDPGPPPDVDDVRSPHARRLRTVARLSRRWGVLRYGDGKAVWAKLPLAPPSPARPVPARPGPRRVLSGAREAVGAGVTAPRHRRFATADPEHAHAFLRSLYGEHTLRWSGPTGFHLEYDGFVTNRFAVEHLRHGASVEGLFAPDDAVVVVHVLAGDLRIDRGREELRARAGDVVLCASGTALRLDSSALEAEVVRLPATAVARVAAELVGFGAPSVPLAPGRPVSPARAAYWRATVAHLRRDVLANTEVMHSPLARATVLRTLVAALLETFSHPAREALGGDAERWRSAPRTVRRAVAFIEEHAGDDIGLSQIVAASGIGPRGLQLAFRRHADVTPLEYLRRVRLDRAHQDLETATPAEATVGAVADRWGFFHHGNFSALYLRTYGRSPSVTLRS
jgi:AraC-like DNA-binding protein